MSRTIEKRFPPGPEQYENLMIAVMDDQSLLPDVAARIYLGSDWDKFEVHVNDESGEAYLTTNISVVASLGINKLLNVSSFIPLLILQHGEKVAYLVPFEKESSLVNIDKYVEIHYDNFLLNSSEILERHSQNETQKERDCRYESFIRNKVMFYINFLKKLLWAYDMLFKENRNNPPIKIQQKIKEQDVLLKELYSDVYQDIEKAKKCFGIEYKL